jgi:hypothetical protein
MSAVVGSGDVFDHDGVSHNHFFGSSICACRNIEASVLGCTSSLGLPATVNAAWWLDEHIGDGFLSVIEIRSRSISERTKG